MQIRRLFATGPVENNITIIQNEEAYYGIKVLRLKTNDPVEVLTDKGILEGTVKTVTKKSIEITLNSLSFLIKGEPSVNITLFQAIPDHFEKFELIVQKTTELGVSKIVPFTSSHTDSKYKKIDITKKLKRAKKIAKEAVRQCKRTFPPEITDLTSFENAILEAEKSDSTFFFAEYNVSTGEKISPDVKKIGIFIGAEGGFSDEEFSRLKNKKFIPVHLKGRVLRTETAAITAISLIQMKFGDYKNSI
jgi:16S rRNA (uracil1498-N3)-methyltransferase